MNKIIFVCTGNTCRSPMAEGIMNVRLREAGLADTWVAESRGVAAMEGEGPATAAVAVLGELYGADISRHKARRLTASDADQAALILTLTRSHAMDILADYPQATDRVHVLKSYAAGRTDDLQVFSMADDIRDPWGMSQATYARCAAEIDQALDGVMKRIRGM